MQAMKQRANFALILAAMTLAACGSGGAPVLQQPTGGQQPAEGQQPTGGEQPTGSQQPTGGQQPAGGEQPTGGQQGTGAEGTARSTDLARTFNVADRTARFENARAAANAIPRMGSVTQSSNVDSSGRTTDRASAAFDGSQLSLTVAHQDGTSTQVAAPVSAFVSTSEESLFQGHSSGQWMLGSEAGAGSYYALIATISYSPTIASDWLAGGLLITADGSGGPVGAGDVDQVAWIDGPEVSGNVDLTGASGSAVYTGNAIGNYTATSSGSLEVGAFQSPFRLTANFDASSISGCVGCDRGVQVSPYYISEGGDDLEPDGVPLEFRLGQIAIGNDGIFNNGDVTISPVPGAQELTAESLQDQSGKWGGRFSTRLVADSGRPRAAAVAFGGSFNIVSGTAGAGNTAVVYQGISLPTPSN